MELHLREHRWEARLPDWAAAAVAGFGAGGVLMLLEIGFVMATGNTNPWQTTRMVAALMMGPEVLDASGYSAGIVAAALLVHYLLGTAFGVVLAALIAPFRLDSSTAMALAAGALFGLLLYAFNFLVLASTFPWFAPLRGWPTLVAHLVFGMTAAFTYLKLERPEGNR
jgi:uncharacterized protein YhhL (DUF1145 family)